MKEIIKQDYLVLIEWISTHLPPCSWTREGDVVTCHIQIKKDVSNIEKLKGLPFGD